MVSILKMLESGDLISSSIFSNSYKEIRGAYSGVDEWVVVLSGYNSMLLFYNISENKWTYRSTDSSVTKECKDVVFYKKMDASMIRDKKLEEVLSGE